MDTELLQALNKLFDEELGSIHANSKDLKLGQEKLISKLDEIESVNATRHTDMMNDISDIKDNLNNVEIITSKNWNDIAKLKAVK